MAEGSPSLFLLLLFWLRVHVIGLNLIAFIISIETEALVLALAIYINKLNEKNNNNNNKKQQSNNNNNKKKNKKTKNKKTRVY